MPRVWVSIGSNIDREARVRAAVAALATRFGPLVLSPVYESDAVGFEGEPFYNLVVGFDSDESIEQLAAYFRDLEETQGRLRGSQKFASRTLDVDVLTYGGQVVQSGKISLPRDEITEYAFVLRPLADVAADEPHPVIGKTYAELWAAFDQASQPLWPVEFSYVDETDVGC